MRGGENIYPKEAEEALYRLADFKCPRKVEFVEAFPKTATGKIQKNKIVDAYLDRSDES